MKKVVTRVLALALAFTTMVSMSGIMTVSAEAATKSNVTVNYTGKKTQKAAVKSISATVDGVVVKNNKATVYLSGKNSVKIDTTVTVNVKGKKTTKKFKNNVAKVTYASSNKKVATVNKNGVITIKKTGTATITIKSKANTKKTLKIKLTVKNGVKKMKLNSSKKVSLTVGDKHAFTPKVTTYRKVKTTITASSSNKKVAKVSVSKKGKVTITAVKAGTAEITVAPKYGSDKAQVIKVTVKEKTAPVEVVKEYKTKVEFADPASKKVVLTGTITWDNQNGIAQAVKEFAAALGGNYTVKINGRSTKVVDGKVDEADIAKIPVSGSKTDATVEATVSVQDVLDMVGKVDAKATAKFNGSFKMSGIVISNVSLVNKELAFKLGDKEMKAFVENGDLYLDGDQSALFDLYKAIYDDNKTVIKGYKVVEK